MTERELRDKIVGIFTGWIGKKEADGSHMAIVNIYNGHKPLARGYKVTSKDPWCATAASAAAIAAELTDIIPTECSCGNLITLAKKMGIWVENDRHKPEHGDYVLYDWDDKENYAVTDNTGWPEHIGMVATVAGNNMNIVEGNIKDAVGTRQLEINGRYIRGYICPKYAEKAARMAQNTATGTSGATTTTGNDAIIWNFLKSKGLNDYAIAGLMGNLFAESGLSPINLQNTFEKKFGLTDAEYTAKVDDGTYTNFVRDSAGYGLAQWTYWSRKQALKQYTDSRKASIGDLQMQLDFLWKELQGYTAVIKVLKAAKSIKEASDAVLTGYEKPANQSDSVKAKRTNYGQGYFDKFATTKPSASTGEGASGASGTPYKVKSGDNLTKIAKAYNTTVDAIVAANKAKYPKITKNYIVVGWELIVGQATASAGTSTPAKPTATTYTVKRGDNLTKIAKAYNTTVDAIVKANKAKYPTMTKNYIRVGWKLSV